VSAVEVLPVVGDPALAAGDICHWSCCDDSDVLLCGEDGVGIPRWSVLEFACVPCELAANDGSCPRFGRCHTDPEVAN
jgi:hypothetical protein